MSKRGTFGACRQHPHPFLLQIHTSAYCSQPSSANTNFAYHVSECHCGSYTNFVSETSRTNELRHQLCLNDLCHRRTKDELDLIANKISHDQATFVNDCKSSQRGPFGACRWHPHTFLLQTHTSAYCSKPSSANTNFAHHVIECRSGSNTNFVCLQDCSDL